MRNTLSLYPDAQNAVVISVIPPYDELTAVWMTDLSNTLTCLLLSFSTVKTDSVIVYVVCQTVCAVCLTYHTVHQSKYVPYLPQYLSCVLYNPVCHGLYPPYYTILSTIFTILSSILYFMVHFPVLPVMKCLPLPHPLFDTLSRLPRVCLKCLTVCLPRPTTPTSSTTYTPFLHLLSAGCLAHLLPCLPVI